MQCIKIPRRTSSNDIPCPEANVPPDSTWWTIIELAFWASKRHFSSTFVWQLWHTTKFYRAYFPPGLGAPEETHFTLNSTDLPLPTAALALLILFLCEKPLSTAYGKRDACTAGCKAAGRQSSTGEHLYFSEFGCPSWIVSYSHILVAVIFYHQHVWKNRENHTHLTAAKGKPRDGTTQ